MKYSIHVLLVLFLTLVNCSPKKEHSSEEEEISAGELLLRESIEAHGGMEKWRNNGLISFRWTYHMTDKGIVVDSRQSVDPNNFETLHTVPDTEISYGYTKGEFWVSPADAELKLPVPFWTHTPVYFMGIPFVFDDANASFEKLSETLAFEGKDYTQVKITYAPDAGASPDDYYVLLIDPETKLVRAAYYTVTHPLVTADGVGPAKLITLDNLKHVGGLLLPSGHQTYTMEDGKIGSLMRHTDVSEVLFKNRDDVDFAIPDGAKRF